MSETLITLHTEIAALQADNAALLRVLYAADRELETVYGGIADHADAPLWKETPRYKEIHSVLDQEHCGTEILAELGAARIVVDTLREWMAGDVSRSAITIALIDYDKATKARPA